MTFTSNVEGNVKGGTQFQILLASTLASSINGGFVPPASSGS